MRTAVNSLIDELSMLGYFPYGIPEKVIQQHKEIEKENMKKICFKTLETCEDNSNGSLNDYFERVYNETFKEKP